MRYRVSALALLVAGLHANAAPVAASSPGPLVFNSGAQQVTLLELYTSEGCSSCPPAEKWFSSLLTHPDLWRRIVPVVFHVNYWDDLGWKDPYGTAENSQRQRHYQTEGGVNSVYTPGFVLNGREWRGWFSRDNVPTLSTPAGHLNVEVIKGQIHAAYKSDKIAVEPLALQVALLGFDLITQVPAGENQGEALTHQFVVLKHMTTLSDTNAWTLQVPQSTVPAQKLALAAWVTLPDTQTPLQATGGWIN